MITGAGTANLETTRSSLHSRHFKLCWIMYLSHRKNLDQRSGGRQVGSRTILYELCIARPSRLRSNSRNSILPIFSPLITSHTTPSASGTCRTSSEMKCCCGREDCAYLRYNTVALDGLEKDVRTAAGLGQVRILVYLSHILSGRIHCPTRYLTFHNKPL